MMRRRYPSFRRSPERVTSLPFGGAAAVVEPPAGLVRVQATPRASAAGPTLAVTFAVPPVVGHAIVVPVILMAESTGPSDPPPLPLDVTDTYGNSYAVAAVHDYPSSSVHTSARVLYCPRVETTGPAFTVTVTSAQFKWWEAVAIEVGGFVGSLAVDQATGQDGASTAAVTSGATGPLTADDVFAVAVCAIVADIAITVEPVTPPWVIEMQELSSDDYTPGEADSRILTGAIGTVQQANWTIAPARNWTACLAVFGVPPPASVLLPDGVSAAGLLYRGPVYALTFGGPTMAGRVEIEEGWTATLSPFVLTIAGTPTDLTGLTVEAVLRGQNGLEVDAAGDVTVADQVAHPGEVAYTPDANDFVARQSPYTIRFRVTDAVGAVAYFPNGWAMPLYVYRP